MRVNCFLFKGGSRFSFTSCLMCFVNNSIFSKQKPRKASRLRSVEGTEEISDFCAKFTHRSLQSLLESSNIFYPRRKVQTKLTELGRGPRSSSTPAQSTGMSLVGTVTGRPSSLSSWGIESGLSVLAILSGNTPFLCPLATPRSLSMSVRTERISATGSTPICSTREVIA